MALVCSFKGQIAMRCDSTTMTPARASLQSTAAYAQVFPLPRLNLRRPLVITGHACNTRGSS